MIGDSDVDFEDLSLFTEPEDFRPKTPEPTSTTFNRNPKYVTSGRSELIVHLPPKHSLWAHKLWNAGQSLANYLDEHKSLYKDKLVLELGAAASLPSIICAINGAKKVVSTDYPDPTLIKNIELNAKENIPDELNSGLFSIKGFIWGQEEIELDEPLTKHGKFDLILLADLIFNHNQHSNLLKSCKQMLAPNGYIITTFSHHITKWAHRDMVFFDVANEYGFKSEKLFEQRWDPMFPEDAGDLDVRSTVHCWKLTL
ncbi:hypothetical protein BC833DRAFT_541870, partial [Globomyces pollinis-pini]